MGRSSREKGKRGEREFAKALRSLGLDARRTQQYAGTEGTSDVSSSIPGVHWEVKRYARIGAVRFMDQAERDAKPGDVPLLAMREDGGRWLVVVPLDDLPRFAEQVVASLETSVTTLGSSLPSSKTGSERNVSKDSSSTRSSRSP